MAEEGPAETGARVVAPPLVGIGASFEGVVAARGTARIDGRLVGDLVACTRLVIGEGADVRARVEAEEVVVQGRLEGDVHARRRVELGPRAEVVGRLLAPRLAVADGCRFDGSLEMGEADGEAAAASPGSA